MIGRPNQLVRTMTHAKHTRILNPPPQRGEIENEFALLDSVTKHSHVSLTSMPFNDEGMKPSE